jgi:hypothetical protein
MPHSPRNENMLSVRRVGRLVMDTSHPAGAERRRQHSQIAAVVWIAVLIVSWLLIADWRMLPDLVSTTIAAIP